MLKTDQKDRFLQDLKDRLEFDSGIKAFTVQSKRLAWHPNELDTRWFLVLRLESATVGRDGNGMQQLQRLLQRCNNVATSFGQPELYASDSDGGDGSNSMVNGGEGQGSGDFHISIAWSLTAPKDASRHSSSGNDVNDSSQHVSGTRKHSRSDEVVIPHDLLARLRALSITFTEVKVRIGQDVHRLPLKMRRRRSSVVID